jgi:hypothetical protein
MTLVSRWIVLLMVLVASAATAQGRSNWVVYVPKGPGFRVELPMEPTVKSADVKTTHGPARATYFHFRGENGLEGRMEVKDYERGRISKDPRGFLDESRGYYEMRSPLRSESRFTLDGSPADRFVTDTVDGRIATIQEVVVGDRFISVICFVPKAQGRSADVDRIFRSFSLAKS